VIRDLGSTNGTRQNGTRVQRSHLAAGDDLRIGSFDLEAEEVTEGGTSVQHPTPFPPPDPGRPTPPATIPDERRERDLGTPGSRVPNASIIRPLRDFSAAYGLHGEPQRPPEVPAEEPESAYGHRVFGFLTRLAQLLITAESVSEVLHRVVNIVFEALPVERGFVMLQDPDGEIVCELARTGDSVEERPAEGVPVSRTILDTVMEERVALLTYDALADDRLVAGESIRLHGIRAAMSAPLWSGERIIGVIQVDSPVQVGAFGERDLDFLTALANYAAVAVERLRSERRVEQERRLRGRFERYHSPAVIEEMMRDSDTEGGDAGEAVRKLRTTEASVLFADLVGFSAFAERSDPEQVAELLEAYFNQAVAAVFDAGGTLDKFIGDAIMAFFGAPLAQPDHARRAVEAAVRLQRDLAAWNRERVAGGQPEVAARIAINSGPVVVGDVGSATRVDYTVLGNTVNVAARLEQFVARPGDVVIGEETRRLVDGAFATEPLGSFQLKGLQKKVEAWRVVAD
jgi:adenylate cyclase